MGWSDFFGFGGVSVGGATTSGNDNALGESFPMVVKRADFIECDIFSTFSKILIDVVDRTQGITDKVEDVLWDNCVKDSSEYGLISMLAYAMATMSELCLVYKSSTNILRKATMEEADKIKKDYEKSAKSSLGVLISFQNFKRTELLKLYASLEYCSIGSLYKSANVAMSVQFKIDELRSAVGLQDSAVARAQGVSMAAAVAQGKNVMLSGKDAIVTTTPDVVATEKSIALTDAKKAYYLGFPISYITGAQGGSSLSDTGQGDTRAIERGLRPYFFSIIKPALKALFNISAEFRTQDFINLKAAIDVISGLDLVSEDILNLDQKRNIVNRVLEIKEKDNQPDVIRQQAEAEVDSLKAKQDTPVPTK
jgi:hypothetical protein